MQDASLPASVQVSPPDAALASAIVRDGVARCFAPRREEPRLAVRDHYGARLLDPFVMAGATYRLAIR